MNTPLLCLTLASLLTSTLGFFQRDPYEYLVFLYHHTMLYRVSGFDCNKEMMYRQRYATKCINSSLLILGDTTDAVPEETVLNICRAGGTSVGDNMVKSTHNFRLVKCTLQKDTSTALPNCVYKPKYFTEQIIVSCKEGFPVHLEGFPNN